MTSTSSVLVKDPICPFTEYLNSSVLSDIRVILDGETFQCHKIILARSIPYFNGLFNFYEANTAVVELKDDLHVSGFKEILNWAYTGEYTISADNVANVIEASRFLHVDSILDKCIECIENLDLKEQLIDIFFVTSKQDFPQAADVIRHRIMDNIAEIVTTDKFVNMTLGELKLLLFSERSLSADVSKNISRRETVEVHPILILKAILEWTCSDEKRLATAPDLLSFLNLMEIPNGEIAQACNKFEQIIVNNPVVFIQLFSRLLKFNGSAPSVTLASAPTSEGKCLYIVSFATDNSVKINSYSLDGSSWSCRESAVEEIRSKIIFKSVYDFHVCEGNAYFLVRDDIFGVGGGYNLNQFQKSQTNSGVWERTEIKLPIERFGLLERITILKFRTGKLAILILNKGEYYISEWTENKWNTIQVEEEENKHFLLKYCDNLSGNSATLCSVPIVEIPEPPNFVGTSVTAVCASSDRIYVFTKHADADTPKGWVFDTTTRLWAELLDIPTSKKGKKVLSAAEIVDGAVIALLGLKDVFKWDVAANSWTKLKNYPFRTTSQHYWSFGY